MKEVTDPAILAELNKKEVTDPNLLAQLEGKQTKYTHNLGQIQSSPLELFMAGMGKGFVDIGRGVGQRLGMVTPQEIEEARKTDVLWGGSPYAKVGEFIGGTLPYVPIPAGVGAGLLARAGIGAATGAGIGYLQPTTEKESEYLNALAGGLLGGATPMAIAPIGKVVHAAKGITGKGIQELKNLSKRYDIPLSLGELKNNPVIQKAETWLEAIPFMGISGFRMKQQAKAERAGLDFLSKYIVNPNSDDIIKTNRQFASGLFEDLKEMIPRKMENQRIDVDQIRPIAKDLANRFPNIFKKFQDTKREQIIQSIISDTEDVITTGMILDPLGGKPFSYRAKKQLTFDEIWTLRDGLGEMIGQARKKLALGDVSRTELSQLSRLYEAVNNQIDNWANDIGKPEITEAIKTANKAYQQYVVKYRTIQEAMDRAEGIVGAGESFSPKKLSTILKGILQDQKWSEAKLFNQDEITHMTGLIKIMQIAKRGGQFMENPPTGNRWGIAQMIGLGLGIPGGVAMGGSPGMGAAMIGTELATAGIGKFLTTTNAGKNFCLAASKIEPNSPYLLKLTYEMLPKAMAVQGTNVGQ